MYVPLHGHSTFSFLEALGQPKDIIACAKELGFSSIAITDYNGMFGIPAFYQASKESKSKDDGNDIGVKSIFGLEIGFVMDLNSSSIGKSIGNICLLAESDKGYHNMMELVAFANQTGLINGVPRLDLNILKEKSEGIVVFTGGDMSWISKMQLSGESDIKIAEIYDMLHKVFNDKCYLEITAQDEKTVSGVRKINNFIYSLSKKTNTKLIVNNNYRYLREKDKEAREIALAIKDGAKMYDANRRKPLGKYHIMGSDEIRSVCIGNGYDESEVDEWMQNNGILAESLNASMLLNQKLFPQYKIPEDIQILYDRYGATSIEI